MKQQAFTPYLPSWKYIPDGGHSLYLSYRGEGITLLKSISFIK